MKKIVKKGRKVVGFAYDDSSGQSWYAFGKPSQVGGYISFACGSISEGVEKVKEATL